MSFRHFTSYALYNSPMPKPPTNVHVERLNSVISDILNPIDSQAFSFRASVKNYIRQYRLANHLDANEVINEAYKRAMKAIAAEKVVKNWRAWLKVTCLNVVRERSRDRKRQIPTAPDSPVIANIECPSISRLLEKEEEEDRIRETRKKAICLRRAIEEYSEIEPDSAQLLHLRLVCNWSWGQVRQYLVDQGIPEVPSDSTLRKRASRAKTKIRHIYHRIEEEYIEAGACK